MIIFEQGLKKKYVLLLFTVFAFPHGILNGAESFLDNARKFKEKVKEKFVKSSPRTVQEISPENLEALRSRVSQKVDALHTDLENLKLDQNHSSVKVREQWGELFAKKVEADALSGFIDELGQKEKMTQDTTSKIADIQSKYNTLKDMHPERVQTLERLAGTDLKAKVNEDLVDDFKNIQVVQSLGIDISKSFEAPTLMEKAKTQMSRFGQLAKIGFKEAQRGFYEKVARNPEKAQEIRANLIDMYSLIDDELSLLKTHNRLYEMESLKRNAQERLQQHQRVLSELTGKSVADEAKFNKELEKTAELIIKADIDNSAAKKDMTQVVASGVRWVGQTVGIVESVKSKLIKDLETLNFTSTEKTDAKAFVTAKYEELQPTQKK